MADDDDKPVLPSQAPEVVVEQPADPVVIRMPVDVRGVTLSVIAVLGAILMLQYAQSVLIPLVIGVLLSYVLGPAVDSMTRHGVNRVVGSTIVLALLCGAVGLGIYSLTGQVMAIIDRVPEAARRMTERLDERGSRPDEERSAIEKVQDAAKEVEEAAEQATDDPEERRRAETRGVQRVQVVEPAFAARNYLWAGGMGLMALLGQAGMVLFLVFFLLVTGDLFKRKLVRIAGPTLTKKKITVQIMDDINRQISNFLRVQVITSVIVGVATAVALWLFGVEQYLVWGLLAGIFNSIPYLGPIIVSGGLAVVAFMQFDDIWMTIYVSGTAMVITSLEGWLLTPALMSRAAQMNAVAIFVGLLFWSWVWGVMGTILAVPMLMMLKAVCDRVEDLQPVGELLGE
jgi:predicted PurR-regulated permease PerM